MKLLFQFFLLLSICILSACSNKSTNDTKESIIITPELIFDEALNEFDKKNYDLAVNKFEEIESKFPLSNQAIQSQIMTAFVHYLKLDYISAISILEKVIRQYPAYKNIDYVYYMKAVCYYEQIENPELDGKYNILALQYFTETINRFPNSEYARDSNQKIILINENIAGKHMSIAMFYLNQKKYLAALKRYQKVINEYSQSKFTPEALHRLVEIYYSLGMIEDAKKTAAVLGYNYPDSKWYEYSYHIVGEKESNELEKSSFLKKLLKKITLNDEKN
jgi:outer membrane protein assembly factor BamD